MDQAGPTPTPTLESIASRSPFEEIRITEESRPSSILQNLDNFRVDQSFATDTTEVIQSVILVSKPKKDCFFRAHPEWRFAAWLLEFEQRNYLVLPSCAEEVEGTARLRLLVPCITRTGQLFVWPLGQIKTIGQTDSWTLSAHKAFSASRQGWIRMYSHQPSSAYRFVESSAAWPEPCWPDKDLNTIMEEAFSDSVITDVDHPVLRALRGEVS